MNKWTVRILYCLLATCFLFAFAAPLAYAANVPISGSYEVIEKTDLGPQIKIVLRLHLTNRGEDLLHLQNVILSDFAHSHSGRPLTSSIVLHPCTTEDATQEFVIPRAQFDEWEKGLRPRVILQLQTGTGATITQVIRLERVSARKGE